MFVLQNKEAKNFRKTLSVINGICCLTWFSSLFGLMYIYGQDFLFPF